MGCDIHSAVEVLKDGAWHAVKERIFPMGYPYNGQTHTAAPFDVRSYGMFAFLAGVRNYSYVTPLSEPRQWPGDQVSFDADDCDDYHSRSWLSLKELLDFDYSQLMEDRRCMRDGNGAAEAGKGVVQAYQSFLGDFFFRDLEIMKGLSDDPAKVRVVFAFDN